MDNTNATGAAKFETFEAFEVAYRSAFKSWAKYTPKQVGFATYAEIMADLADAYPEWAERAEAIVD